MDPEPSRAADSGAGEAQPAEPQAPLPAAGEPSPAPAQGRVLRVRGASRSHAAAALAAGDEPGSGRVLRERTSRGVAAAGERRSASGQAQAAAGDGPARRRKAEYPRRRRNAGARAESAEERPDDGGLAVGADNKRDSSDRGEPAPVSRPTRTRRPRAPARHRDPPARAQRPPAALVCKAEPDPETSGYGGEGAAEELLSQAGVSEEDEDIMISEEDPPFRDDPKDQNYKPETERDPPKPRRRPPKPKEEKKSAEIKTEEVDVKQENEFGEESEPPRKRGRRRKDDKSPRLPKRRKKPPIQYVRCEMEGCGTVLAHPRYLQHHIKYQHLLKKKYVCPHPSCGRLFRLQKQLLRHAKHHTDQRDYICEYCARAFKSSHNLAVHRMIHTGEKPLQCEICGFTCRQKASLNWHMKKHDADTFYQFSCNICGKKFEKKDSVVAHKAKSHPEVLIAEALAANAGALITSSDILDTASPTAIAAAPPQPTEQGVSGEAGLVGLGGVLLAPQPPPTGAPDALDRGACPEPHRDSLGLVISTETVAEVLIDSSEPHTLLQ
ncbi:E3 ubiquitin-protein ligase ZFP91 isoform X2 [Lepisosteus oculatus]|uniref:E3 ubiquitin-protein ligase ZFP91 isoform X2 n=1 Tax=Lepisosteus oculatus TaxID=7918 RepID=UPI003720006A